MNNLPLNKDLKKQLSIIYLEKILNKIKSDEMNDNDFDKIIKIIFQNGSNCDIDLSDKDNKEVLYYTFLGWYINENLKDNNIFFNDKDV